jgi:hypothetical protein
MFPFLIPIHMRVLFDKEQDVFNKVSWRKALYFTEFSRLRKA